MASLVALFSLWASCLSSTTTRFLVGRPTDLPPKGAGDDEAGDTLLQGCRRSIIITCNAFIHLPCRMYWLARLLQSLCSCPSGGMITFTDFLTLSAVLRWSWTSHLLLRGINDRWVHAGSRTVEWRIFTTYTGCYTAVCRLLITLV